MNIRPISSIDLRVNKSNENPSVSVRIWMDSKMSYENVLYTSTIVWPYERIKNEGVSDIDQIALPTIYSTVYVIYKTIISTGISILRPSNQLAYIFYTRIWSKPQQDVHKR